MLSGLVAVNRAQMERAGPGRPRIRDLIASGQLRYSPVDPNEHWQTYDEVLGVMERDGAAYADCEDLASMAAAEMNIDQGAADYDPSARVVVYRTGPSMSHVIVESKRFGHLDPSKSAGMGWRDD